MQLLGDGSNILLIVLGFGLLIAVHELGHFLAARWAGIRVEDFAIGMGPTVVAWRRGIGLRAGSTAREMERRFGCPPESVTMQRLQAAGVGETEYSLRVLPLGGFVRMKGQEDLVAIDRAGDPDAYPSRPVWKRMVVVSAGVVMNVILALLLYMAAFMVGVRFDSPTVGQVGPNGPAATARALQDGPNGLRPGDHIKRVDGAPVSTFADVQIAVAMSKPGQAVTLEVARPGVDAMLRFTAEPTDDPVARLRSLSITPARDPTLSSEALENPMAQSMLARSGLSAAGVGGGWRLVSAQGTPCASADALAAACTASRGQPVQTVWRDPEGVERTATLLPEPMLPRIQPADAPGVQEFSLLGLSPLTRIDWIREGSPNQGLLRPGDVVLAIDDLQGPRIEQFRDAVRGRPSAQVNLTILREGTMTSVRAQVDAQGRLDVLVAPALECMLMARPIDRALVNGLSTPTPAASLELGPLAAIPSVQGAPVHNWRELAHAIQKAADAESIELEVRSMGAPSAVPARLAMDSAGREQIRGLAWAAPMPMDLFDPMMTTLGAPGRPLEAAKLGLNETIKLATLTWLTLDRLARGSVPVDQLRGPVGIVHVGTRVADRGFTYLVFFLAMISVNLAVLNFLPLPIVDGGLFVYLVYEALRGRPPSVRFQNAATLAGLLLIGGLFLVTFYNDVMRLVG
ncbi:MAG: site-2 protease family protein [Phycisphaerales bacterium]|jgi:regulator of sigma E protease